uniref:Laminin subunit beta-1 n=1 Tax=Drosophila melanogaster TaxID=7227 RepID=LAMB1_DROME|nr:LanB1, isoform A [Drosophila melanogaster]NP_723319.1 LanB1, isoform B [Drosophila melanogaster]P11046.4 RecName: Full=Laminin subunit beta-1; AltName: Full=Laminin B1 chain; Flags: Precursor [Drosophila melanogaster]AAF52563.1 LanB1, isoform A [Drosophila melanogaster]AAN10647.1 LanB1, isoform B [Drosophila melanogaster]|eukprot:NP_476618.1 LanB1, isoform A [Drosophila melanogaster]
MLELRLIVVIVLALLSWQWDPVDSQRPPQHGRRDRPKYPPNKFIKTHPCERSSCYPATGNLLIGRENRLTASSTCGLHSPERFCILSHLQDKKCFLCDTREETKHDPYKNHRIGQIIYKTKPGTNIPTWWQSENGKENATIQLDLEAEFHFTHLIITFTTFRPAAMYIERSFDFGQTWHIYRYFAYDCKESFPGVPTVLENITDVMCTSRYSNVEPSRNGEVIFRVLPPNINVTDPYAEHVQNQLKMTNLRIQMTKLHKLGDNLLDSRLENEEKYYYGISNMVVRGSCSCYGHASQCLPLDPAFSQADNEDGMVHGRCECTHNTKGMNCEECEDFFNDLPWKPAFGKKTNACKKCECNDHAVSCHFDEAVFTASGFVSGGVCDNCLHNTRGQHCEECMPYFYRDPEQDITSERVCQPCDCDPQGSSDDGICDSLNELEEGAVAGACHCKAFVTGRRCNQCKDGYWNLQSDNPEGCEPCTCNPLGTLNNSGCVMRTGECKCKKYVTGKDCNQCMPETYGLSESPEGCSLCNCDAGGSYDNYCDVISGQCRCRPHMTGRSCSQPKQNYFIPLLPEVHEAEVVDECISYGANGNCSLVAETPDGSFTGIGFTRVPENSELVFTVGDIPRSMPYDAVIRYQSTSRGDWENAFITLVRPDQVDPEGGCGELAAATSSETRIPFSLPDRSRQVVALNEVCLEAGKVYKFRIYFERKRHDVDSPTATILVDSLTLIPRIDVTPIFQGSVLADIRKKDYEKYNCKSSLYDMNYKSDPKCQNLDNILSVFVHDGASMCNCNPTGSLSKVCESNGGYCQCKPNVVGRQCDQCAPGTYGFGPEGCKACDCNSIGSKDKYCDLITGQCQCVPNTYGRECNQCQPGYWNFPECRVCQCNGHAATCDPIQGTCIDCQDSTTGYSCDSCLDGYYGNPLFGSEIGCRPCRCPETVASGLAHADGCSLDTRNNNMLCHCQEGYSGSRCEICADNFFGNPDNGGTCSKCECSNNVDLYDTGNCDRQTGACLKCLYQTTGDHCELCKDGFFGDALQQNCQQCECDFLGTNNTIAHCDRFTGQCPCLPNVQGVRCDQCAENHWKIASGEGCESCNCDPIGALHEQCNSYTGQCQCKPGFGGRACNQCQAHYWGNPNEKCQPCECDQFGAADFQCDRETGNCVCHEGIGGYKCNECARGYIGQFPHCSPCGECFNNWDLILSALEDATTATILRAKEIKQVGATGAYTSEFSELDKKLQHIRNLLQNTSVSLVDIEKLDYETQSLRDQLQASHGRLSETEQNLDDIYNSLSLSGVELESLQNHSRLVQQLSKELKENGIQLQESNIEGALNLTRHAYERVSNLSTLKDEANELASNTDRNCKRVENLSNKIQAEADDLANNNKLIEDYRAELTSLTSQIPELNNQVCGKPGDPCDSLCGGAGCGHCGGFLSCEHGAKTHSEEALKVAKDAETAITSKKDQADQTIRALTQAKLNASEAYEKAKRGFEQSERYLNQTNANIKLAENLFIALNNFQENKTASPSESKELAQKTLDLDLKLEPEEIETLGDQINRAVSSLKNVEAIIYRTKPDLDRVNNLQSIANATKEKADKILDSANSVVESLAAADESQGKAKDAIQQANSNIELAGQDLEKIDEETYSAEAPANNTAQQVEKLAKKVQKLQNNIMKNDRDAKEITKEAGSVKLEAMRARGEANNLQSATSATNQTLTDRASRSENARERAKQLLQRASKLTVDTNAKLKDLNDLQTVYLNKNQQLLRLQAEIGPLNKELNEHLIHIKERGSHYRQCYT